jgi:hypothetical protein
MLSSAIYSPSVDRLDPRNRQITKPHLHDYGLELTQHQSTKASNFTMGLLEACVGTVGGPDTGWTVSPDSQLSLFAHWSLLQRPGWTMRAG